MIHPSLSYLERARLRNKPGSLKAWVFKLVFSRVGPVIGAAVSAAVGWLVTQLAAFQIYMDADMQIQVASFFSFVIYGVINYLVNRYAGDNAAAIQEALGAKVDRWIDKETIEAAAARAPKPKEILHD
jgi:hypothetical protein